MPPNLPQHFGETVLVFGVGGGVSLAALQIAKAAGARVLVTSRSVEKLSRATGLGADATVNAPPDRIPKDVMDLTQGRGVDVVIENIGGSIWNAALKCSFEGVESSRAAQRLAINRRPICDASLSVNCRFLVRPWGIRMNSLICSNGAQTDVFCLQSTGATRSTGFARQRSAESRRGSRRSI